MKAYILKDEDFLALRMALENKNLVDKEGGAEGKNTIRDEVYRSFKYVLEVWIGKVTG